MKQMAEMAQKRNFVGTGPGIARMSINDQKSLLTKNDTDEQSDLETWTGSQEVGFSPRQPTGMDFSVEIDLEKKTAAVGFFVTIKAKNVNDSRTEYPAAQHRDVEPIKSHSTRDPGMEIFDDLRAVNRATSSAGMLRRTVSDSARNSNDRSRYRVFGRDNEPLTLPRRVLRRPRGLSGAPTLACS